MTISSIELIKAENSMRQLYAIADKIKVEIQCTLVKHQVVMENIRRVKSEASLSRAARELPIGVLAADTITTAGFMSLRQVPTFSSDQLTLISLPCTRVSSVPTHRREVLD